MLNLVFPVVLAVSALSSSLASAAVIFSSCPVVASPGAAGSAQGTVLVDRFKPNEYQRYINRHAKDFGILAKYFSWLLGENIDAVAAQQIGQVIEDVQFYTSLSPEQSCHGSGNPVTLNQAIFPFVMRARDEAGAYRVRYKLCEYYVDGSRQLPFEDACTVVGRESGYTFAELQQRFAILNAHIEGARASADMLTYGAGVVGSLTVFKVLRVLRMGSLGSFTLSLVPAGAAHYAVSHNLTNEFVRDMIDFKGAAEVALVGDLSTSVRINRPIQDFVPYFVRYLDAIE